jgi:hypothetical protein
VVYRRHDNTRTKLTHYRKVPLETGHLDSKHGKCGSNWQQESTKIEPESRDNRARMAAK